MIASAKHILARFSRLMTGRVASRLFWALLLLIHVRALFGFVPIAADGEMFSFVARVVGLGLTAVFCGLKLVDVAWLRLVPGWRSAVAAWMVVALLHVGVLDRSGALEVNDSAAQVALMVGVIGAFGSSMISNAVRRVFQSARRRHAHSRTRVQPGPIGRAVACWFVPSSAVPILDVGPPRAPPRA